MLEKASQFIAKYEGMRLKSYWDVKDWAICFGNRSNYLETTTEEDCIRRLKTKTKQVYNYVKKLYKGQKFNTNQWIALISLYYNTRNPSHVHWRITTEKSEKSIKNAWVSYNMAANVYLPGLRKRREEEANLFLTPFVE